MPSINGETISRELLTRSVHHANRVISSFSRTSGDREVEFPFSPFEWRIARCECESCGQKIPTCHALGELIIAAAAHCLNEILP
ncbi:hypothetical protein CEXT_401611 [Caerostris extrusa]|uniref:Uncharacterized protein n=1 Tax=Caerostris extrusa TaxID=172846 RepID=A0AAV4U9J2_CAEEX|nr:hypothetical protein CEXT_401611 [Caerostris extrusa]